jgi:NAD(P)-dependent dehydrogenase (short-subunit alcohol dehydrogenase family)
MSVNMQSTKHTKWTTRMWRTLAALDEGISVSPMEHLQNRIAALEQKVGAGSEPPRNQMESKPAQTTMGRLADKNILITGGNSGIGLAAAQEFDREGARVAICGLNEGSLQAAKETLGAGSLAVRADVSNLTDLDRMFATIKREFGHLDGVFVNAGYSEFLLFEEVTEQSFDKVIAVNFKGPYFTIQKALPLLRQGSSVIITASVGARKGWPTTSTVSTCKAAVVHLARILSAELVDRGIRVNTLSPGPTDTAMFGRFPGEEQGEAVKDVLRTNNPSKRMADPLEIAKLAVYLASDDSAYVVGADFLIDGGVTAISGVGA